PLTPRSLNSNRERLGMLCSGVNQTPVGASIPIPNQLHVLLRHTLRLGRNHWLGRSYRLRRNHRLGSHRAATLSALSSDWNGVGGRGCGGWRLGGSRLNGVHRALRSRIVSSCLSGSPP